jgi:hypothetical protein
MDNSMKLEVFKKILLITLFASLCSCDFAAEKSYIINRKSVMVEDTSLARFSYRIGGNHYEITDLSHRFEIGDDIRKYSTTRQIKN